MEQLSLGEAFGVDRVAVSRLFQDFVASSLPADAPAWRAETRRRRRKILKQTIRRLLFGWRPELKRTEETVRSEYSRAWDHIDFDSYGGPAAAESCTPWIWGTRCMLASDRGATRVRQLLLIRVIERLRPRRVLEVGSGNGINLILLACRFPEIAFFGVELTEAGHRAASAFQRRPALPPGLQDYAPESLPDPRGFQRIRFLQGNATALPFGDGATDLVYSSVALEQMERIRERALAEIARVAGGRSLMIEPFIEVHGSPWPRLNVWRRDYFRGRIADLPRVGLVPIAASSDFPQEAFLKICAVLSAKMPRRHLDTDAMPDPGLASGPAPSTPATSPERGRRVA